MPADWLRARFVAIGILQQPFCWGAKHHMASSSARVAIANLTAALIKQHKTPTDMGDGASVDMLTWEPSAAAQQPDQLLAVALLETLKRVLYKRDVTSVHARLSDLDAAVSAALDRPWVFDFLHAALRSISDGPRGRAFDALARWVHSLPPEARNRVGGRYVQDAVTAVRTAGTGHLELMHAATFLSNMTYCNIEAQKHLAEIQRNGPLANSSFSELLSQRIHQHTRPKGENKKIKMGPTTVALMQCFLNCEYDLEGDPLPARELKALVRHAAGVCSTELSLLARLGSIVACLLDLMDDSCWAELVTVAKEACLQPLASQGYEHVRHRLAQRQQAAGLWPMSFHSQESDAVAATFFRVTSVVPAAFARWTSHYWLGGKQLEEVGRAARGGDAEHPAEDTDVPSEMLEDLARQLDGMCLAGIDPTEALARISNDFEGLQHQGLLSYIVTQYKDRLTLLIKDLGKHKTHKPDVFEYNFWCTLDKWAHDRLVETGQRPDSEEIANWFLGYASTGVSLDRAQFFSENVVAAFDTARQTGLGEVQMLSYGRSVTVKLATLGEETDDVRGDLIEATRLLKKAGLGAPPAGHKRLFHGCNAARALRYLDKGSLNASPTDPRHDASLGPAVFLHEVCKSAVAHARSRGAQRGVASTLGLPAVVVFDVSEDALAAIGGYVPLTAAEARKDLFAARNKHVPSSLLSKQSREQLQCRRGGRNSGHCQASVKGLEEAVVALAPPDAADAHIWPEALRPALVALVRKRIRDAVERAPGTELQGDEKQWCDYLEACIRPHCAAAAADAPDEGDPSEALCALLATSPGVLGDLLSGLMRSRALGFLARRPWIFTFMYRTNQADLQELKFQTFGGDEFASWKQELASEEEEEEDQAALEMGADGAGIAPVAALPTSLLDVAKEVRSFVEPAETWAHQKLYPKLGSKGDLPVGQFVVHTAPELGSVQLLSRAIRAVIFFSPRE